MKYNGDMLKMMADKIDLLDYASQTLEFRQSGKDYFTNCPKHYDATPSLSINTEENYYYCFSCKRSGNIYRWMIDYEGLTFPQAVEKVADITNTEVAETYESTAINLFKHLKKSQEKKRPDLSKRQILDFQKDYLDKYTEEIPYEWVEEGISSDIMKEYNIRIDSDSNRIVYPLIDSNGNFLAAKGRTRYENFKALKLPKYITLGSIGTTDFFVGWQEAMQNIQESRQIIVFEGIKSVMKVRNWGYKNAISSETSHLTDEQIGLLIKSGVKEVVIAYDSDVDIEQIINNVKNLKMFCKVSIMHDPKKLLGGKEAKCSPCDKGVDVFNQLYAERRQLL